MGKLVFFTPTSQRGRIVEIQKQYFWGKGASNHSDSHHTVFSRNSNFKKQKIS